MTRDYFGIVSDYLYEIEKRWGDNNNVGLTDDKMRTISREREEDVTYERCEVDALAIVSRTRSFL